MAVRLPDFTALGGQETGAVNVRPGDITPRYYGEDPEAAALARSGAALGTLGTGLQNFSTGLSRLQSEANLVNAALAQADLHTRLHRTKAAIAAETDPARLDALYSQSRAALDSSGELISDPGYRDLWKAKHTPDVTDVELTAEARQRAVYADRFHASSNLKGAELAQTYAQSDDPVVREQARSDLATIYSTQALAGVITQSQAQAAAHKANQVMVLGRAQNLDAQNRPQEALAHVMEHQNQLEPDDFDRAVKSLRGPVRRQRGEDLGRAVATGGRTDFGGSQAALSADFAKAHPEIFGTPEDAGKNLDAVVAPGGASFQVNKKVAPQIQGFINELEGMGYKIDQETSGGYNNRNKVGVNTSEKSEHAFGTAIDINTDKNKQADTLITDLPPNIGDVAAKWGLKWGGTFEGKKDAMHFEVAQLLPGGKPDTAMAMPGKPTADDPRGMIPVIRAAAAKYGHDPDVAIRVARAEGLTEPLGDGGKSGGAFQLFTGGGLGNEFQQQTGLDPLDPKNEPATIDWAMQNLDRTGWGPYRGAAAAGVGVQQGIAARHVGPPTLEEQFATIDAAAGYSDEEKDIAKVRAQHIDSQRRVAMRGEIATVKKLMGDDLASLEQTGQAIPELTYDRVNASYGPEVADNWQTERNLAQNFYEQTGDFAQLPTFELNQRLDQLRTAGAGQPGFAQRQRLYEQAARKADAIDKLRTTDPSQAVARFPEVIAASQGADLNRPETYQPLVLARMKAMDSLGLSFDAQIPITRQEATMLYRPIGEALRNGNERLARQEMDKTVRYLETGWGGQDTKALGMVLAAGHANERTHDMAASALKALAKSHEPTPAQLRAIDDARVGRGVAEAFGGIAPPSLPSPRPGETYLGQPLTGMAPGPPRPGQGGDFTPGGAYAPPVAGPPAPSYPVPIPAHIKNLRQHPETANYFDAVYGHGAAMRVLGIAPPMVPPP
jgi:hypothetical protein